MCGYNLQIISTIKYKMMINALTTFKLYNFYQTVHLCGGFIGAPLRQLKDWLNSCRLLIGPITRNCWLKWKKQFRSSNLEPIAFRAFTFTTHHWRWVTRKPETIFGEFRSGLGAPDVGRTDPEQLVIAVLEAGQRLFLAMIVNESLVGSVSLSANKNCSFSFNYLN